MGTVYLAEHLTIHRKVAIKVLKPEVAQKEEIRKRFKNEASLMAHLQHPNIVGLIDYLEQEDGLYLIMEYVDGRGLDEVIKDLSQPFPIPRATEIFIKVLSAFAYAHKNGIIHRDVKPSNILITSNDEVKVLDFGIAKLVGETQNHLTKTGTHMGTVYYMSPEQVKAEQLDQRSDIYSLGITFYELLAGFCGNCN
jgi:serine/threonine protein kinase